jgi:hypothetical protein
VCVTEELSTGLFRFQTFELGSKAGQKPCVWQTDFRLSLYQYSGQEFDSLTPRSRDCFHTVIKLLT